ncbi:hypothetical protein EYZ11_005064 [Aspergillus tanneri]|uniref:Homologous-pairing protein 2 winged helix domain-containing protein n=1 Tax=Aspergillus tanneri TaxID=1220188 RepID=A0A4S3JJI7_9EURO|nr:hypothetical protein EYZ11_005064 [Aspergillus tanneri]
MSLKKGTEKSTSGDGVLDGRKQNTCLSVQADFEQAIDISANLHNKVTKTYTAKALKELCHNKKVAGKTSGKQTVYHALQEVPDEAIPEAVAAVDKEMELLLQQLTRLKGDQKKVQTESVVFCAKPLLSELHDDINHLAQERETILARLSQNVERGFRHISKEEKSDIHQDWKSWRRHVSLRSRICRDLWQKCSEVMPGNMSRTELWESLGLEGDPLD